jgi:alanine racemase
MGSLHPCDASAAAAAAVTPVLSSIEGIKAWAAALRSNPRTPNKAHLKIDTGMRRNGIAASEVLTYITAAAQSGVVLEGIMSHFSSADDNYEYTEHQAKVHPPHKCLLQTASFSPVIFPPQVFADAVGVIPEKLMPSVRHICGTAGCCPLSPV